MTSPKGSTILHSNPTKPTPVNWDGRSTTYQEASFCFICSHLTSGQKEGDELRRNCDVMEILRKTRFPRVHGMGDENSPRTILEHE